MCEIVKCKVGLGKPRLELRGPPLLNNNVAGPLNVSQNPSADQSNLLKKLLLNKKKSQNGKVKIFL